MVSFQSITTSIAQNPNAATKVSVYRIKPQIVVESFKIPTMRIEPVKIPVASKRNRSPSPVHSEVSEESLPLPNRMVGVRSSPSVPSVAMPSAPAATPAAAPTPAAAIAKKELNRASGGRILDPICIGLEKADAMYAIASPNVQQTMECEEALRLEERISILYKNESGRSRGWTKTKLGEFLVPRTAQGSRVRTGFDWSKIWTDKDASAILDFVCLAKGIRLAVWRDETHVGLWPAADSTTPPTTPIPTYHIGNTGRSIQKEDSALHSCTILAPYSVEHGLEKLSMDELDSLAEKLGIPIPSGKKTDKVRILASARMKMRIEIQCFIIFLAREYAICNSKIERHSSPKLSQAPLI